MPANSKIGLKRAPLVFWLVIALLIFGLTHCPNWLTKWYTQGWFRILSAGLRWVSSMFSLAIGEFVYIIFIILLIIKFIQYFTLNKIRIKNVYFWKHLIANLLLQLLKLYVVFQLIWGLNYHQSNPAAQFHLKVDSSYSEQELDTLSIHLIHELNSYRELLRESSGVDAPIFDSINKVAMLQQLVEKTKMEYARITSKYPQLSYSNPSIKLSLFPNWGDYLGYLAFYQPITGEAILRADLPMLTQPFTISHEIAHQLGYASETEANFIAFVLASESSDLVFKYSMALQLFTYCQSDHLMMIAKRGDFNDWKRVVERNKRMLSPQVRADRNKIKAFFASRQSYRIKGTEKIYDQFLQWNKQAKGIDSYNDVLRWALAYRKARI